MNSYYDDHPAAFEAASKRLDVMDFLFPPGTQIHMFVRSDPEGPAQETAKAELLEAVDRATLAFHGPQTRLDVRQ